MSRRNSRFQKAVRREQRAEQAARAAFLHDLSRELPEVEGKSFRIPNRKDRRGR